MKHESEHGYPMMKWRDAENQGPAGGFRTRGPLIVTESYI